MIKKVWTIIMLIVILTVSILPNLYIHACSGNLCGNIKKDLPVNSLNPSFCCNDTSFADYTDNAGTIKGKCCHTTVISQSDAFLKQEADPVFYNSEFFISYLIPMICLYDVFKPVSREIQTYADMQHSLSELCGRKLLSLICILRI